LKLSIIMAIPEDVQKSSHRRRLDGADFEPEGYFLLRTPLLPADELEAWGARLQAPAAIDDPSKLESALEADRQELRRWLRDLLSRPVIVEALHVATPALMEALDEWRRDPESKKGRRAEESLVRYAVRMAARATPFGMFAGCTVGHIGAQTRLRLAPRSSYRRHSRLDMGYLLSLAEELNRDAELRRSLRHRPNSSLYRAAGRLRYAEARYGGTTVNYHLVAVEPDEFLDAALARAADGATPDEIAAAVASSDPDGEITFEEARAYVAELIESQLLTSELWPAVTGPEAEKGLIEVLRNVAAPSAHAAAAALARAHERLEELDRNGLGNDPARYGEIVRGLEPLPERADAKRLFQVDLFKPGEMTLQPSLIEEITAGIEALHRLASPTVSDQLGGFRERFIERYGERRLVPLVEALDVEAGVGKPLVAIGGDTAPLLEGLGFSAADEPEKIRWGPREELLLETLTKARAANAFEVVIDADDLRRLETPARPSLADSFQAMAMVSAASEEALAAGDFLVFVGSVFGPSGARLAGRFCHGDPEIARAVSAQLRAEEALDPDAVFAEIVHVGAGRIGNIASRPVLRDFEIAYLGVSGAPRERQIPIDDLLVTVEGSEAVLYSARLQRRVVPRLTSAHNYVSGSLAVYRFLANLQGQGTRIWLAWNWRPLEKEPFLPRVRFGRAVLARARWLVAAEEIKLLVKLRGAGRYAAVRRWREERGIPRLAMLSDEEGDLPVDFDNVLSLDNWLAMVASRSEAELTERWPGFGDLPVRGPEGRFLQEITVPFARRRTPTRRPLPSFADAGERILPPTSRWLYLKIYTGAVTADLVLRDAVAPLVARVMESGAADRWFFVRYADPQNHIRLRFGGEPARLRAIFDLLHELIDPLLDEGRIWKWQLDTYEREVERYGGRAGMEVSERIFHADSEAVLALIEELAGDKGADWRWRVALVGIDRLLADFGLDLAARRDALASLRHGFGSEFSVGPRLTQQLAQRLRETGDELYALLAAGGVAPEHPLAGSFAALERRSEMLAPLVAELRALAARGELAASIDDLAISHVHMFVNRLIRSDPRAHELVLYDLLHRLTMSRLIRANAAPAESKRQGTDPTTAPAM